MFRMWSLCGRYAVDPRGNKGKTIVCGLASASISSASFVGSIGGSHDSSAR